MTETKIKQTAILVFNRAFRFYDNPALLTACQHDSLLPVLILDNSITTHLKHSWFKQAYNRLKQQLEQHNSTLILLTQTQLNRLIHQQPEVVVYRATARCLIETDQIENLPQSYTPFRKWALTYLANHPLEIHSAPTCLPDLPHWYKEIDQSVIISSQAIVQTHESSLPWLVDEKEAQAHWKAYRSHHLQHYKNSRNELMGIDFSSKLSLSLAQGLMSPRQCWQDLQSETADEHTEWLGFELLWRDYFHHLWHKNPQQTLNQAESAVSLVTDKVKLACKEYPFALAMAHELMHTGYLSNRSRQILASFLIYQAGMSWQEGEAFYAHYLLDYDPALNQGNWRYIAGVGADPRGGRVFNLSKQQQQYDANGVYQQFWLNKG